MQASSSAAGIVPSRLIPSRRMDWPGLASGLALFIGTIVIYGNTFAVPLLLDDVSSIAENASIHQWWPIGPALSPPNGAGVGGRPLLNVSYALNYAFGGTSVFGYHLVNLLIHTLAGLVLFALVRGTLRRPALNSRCGAYATPLAFVVSACWTWHPLQTESVTYLSQRAESLMGLFYLLTLFCFARGAETDGSSGRRIWFIASTLSCLASVATKETAGTAPLMVLLYDRTFYSGSFAGAFRRHRSLYGGLAATWLLLGFLLIGLDRRGVGFGHGVNPWAYAAVETRVVVKYLALSIWPSPLVFDYGDFAALRSFTVWPYLLIVVALVSAAAVALRRSTAVGFAAFGFILLLAPTSSIVPIVGQPMAESRLYLASAAIISLVAIGAFVAFGRRSMAGLAIVAIALGFLSVSRNRDYASTESIWADTVAKYPANARAHNNLGEVWLKNPARTNDAIIQFREALRLAPDLAEAHNNLGDAWSQQPVRLGDAIAEYEKALQLWPDFAEAHNNLGHALLQITGRRDDAVAQLKEALRLRPNFAEAHNNLGNAWVQTPDQLENAIAQYQESLRLNPSYAEAHFNLGTALLQISGRLDDALAQCEEAVRLKPEMTDAHLILANALIEVPGRLNDAMVHLDAALRLKPDSPEAHFILGNIWLQTPGRLTDAISQYEEALRLKPDLAEAHFNLGNAWLQTRTHPDDAIAEYQATLRLKPDYAEAHFNLANVWAGQPGRLNDALVQYQETLRLKPDYPEARFNFAVALLNSRGRTAEAAVQLEAFLRLRPDNDDARRLIAKIRSASR